ncbi:MAG: LysE family translocator [Rhodobacter sp.]|nr:LysE family translocator [Rhodobacter sp.]
MTTELTLALAAFAFVTSITPGPNNLMLMASGANFGFRRTIPHMLGIGIGFTIMVVGVGAGLIGLFDRFPATYTVLKAASLGYLLYLAWKIATAARPDGAATGARPMSFLQASAFQWVNPKAWAMALTAISAYAPGQTWGGVLWVALIFGAINLPSVSSWTLLGQQMRRILTNNGRLRLFNVTMAVLLLASMGPVLFA